MGSEHRLRKSQTVGSGRKAPEEGDKADRGKIEPSIMASDTKLARNASRDVSMTSSVHKKAQTKVKLLSSIIDQKKCVSWDIP